VMLGAIISQPAIGLLLDYVGGKAGTPKMSLSYSVSDYQFALSILPISMVVACGLLGVLWWSGKTSKVETELTLAKNLG